MWILNGTLKLAGCEEMSRKEGVERRALLPG